jgi:dolichol-phosphate mannosyltransferase
LFERVKINLEFITKSWEIIIIDDGSTDSTWELIVEQSKIENRLKGLKLSKNFGQHYAITAGLDASLGDWVVVMDGDLQDRPEVIPDLFNKAQEGYDIVFVNRINRPEKKSYLMIQYLFYFLLSRLSGIHFDNRQANYSILSRRVVESFKKFPETARFYSSTIKWLGFKRSEIFAAHGERLSGKSSYSIKKRFNLAIDIILAFSQRPLKFAAYLGASISFISFLIIIWLFLKYLIWGFDVVGWTSLIVSVYFLGGTTLTVLGIMGIYIGRIFSEVKRRPLYLISEKINI